MIVLPGQEDKNLGKLKISNKKNSKKYFFFLKKDQNYKIIYNI